MPRGWQDNPIWRDEPFSRAQAWAWLVEEARWRPSRISIAGKTVELQRGELSHSIRFLAKRWGWGKGVVERFIGRLKTETLIETRTETGQLIISIRNYDEMQATRHESGTASGTLFETPAGQQQDSTGTKKKERKPSKEGNISAKADAPAAPHGDADLKGRIFGTALDWLAPKAGRSKDALRSMVGRWCSQHGDQATLDALNQAAKHSPLDPLPYIEKLLTKNSPAKPSEPLACHESLQPWRQRIIASVGVPAWNSWFAQCEVQHRAGRPTLLAQTPTRAAYIRNNYSGRLEGIFGPQLQVSHAPPRQDASA